MKTEVLIVGAGPVGLSLAIDLGQRGVPTVLIERKPGPLRLPKMERTNTRTMEIYRRLGVADAIRRSGLPADKSMDVYMVESLAKPPLAKIEYPTVNEYKQRIEKSNDGGMPREPYQLISQYTLEPILIERLKSLPCVDVMFNTELLSFEQSDGQVVANLASTGQTSALTVASAYLVGADGANSRVRDILGIEMEGQRELGTITNVFFRCDNFFQKSHVPQGRHYTFCGIDVSGGAAGALVVQDDLKHFAYHTSAPPGSDMAALLQQLTGVDIDPEILHVGPWTQNMLVAKSHSRGRVFLVGDANHVYIPAGGLGMNTGIVDAINLGWKLEATIKGWGRPGLLESYHSERNKVARRTLKFVAHAVEGAMLSRQGYTPEILHDSPLGKRLLRDYLDKAVPLLRRVYDMNGADLGYCYDGSSVVVNDEGNPPLDDAYLYTPSTYPGSHLPHAWIEPDVAVYDRLGDHFTLLLLGDSRTDTIPLEKSFKQAGVPLKLLRLPDPRIRDIYQFDLILVRPDFHVAWRGNEAPEQCNSLISKITGLI